MKVTLLAVLICGVLACASKVESTDSIVTENEPAIDSPVEEKKEELAEDKDSDAELDDDLTEDDMEDDMMEDPWMGGRYGGRGGLWSQGIRGGLLWDDIEDMIDDAAMMRRGMLMGQRVPVVVGCGGNMMRMSPKVSYLGRRRMMAVALMRRGNRILDEEEAFDAQIGMLGLMCYRLCPPACITCLRSRTCPLRMKTRCLRRPACRSCPRI